MKVLSLFPAGDPNRDSVFWLLNAIVIRRTLSTYNTKSIHSLSQTDDGRLRPRCS